MDVKGFNVCITLVLRRSNSVTLVLRRSNSPRARQLKRVENQSSVINKNRKEVGGRVMSKQKE
jgi:hypothetical protein